LSNFDLGFSSSNILKMTVPLEMLPLDFFEVLSSILEGHAIQNLLACGSKRLTANIMASVRRFRYHLRQIEAFPHWAYKFGALSEISVELDETSCIYPVMTGSGGLLPLKPMKAVTKLQFSFRQSSSILSVENRLGDLFPTLTDLSLNCWRQKIHKSELEALPSTLRRFQLIGPERLLATVHD
jgi:hypothetical protein